MEADYQSARLLWLRSGWLKNEGRRNTRETGLAKWMATVASERAAGDAVADPRRQRLLRRVSGRPLLSQLQGRGDLRGHARDPHDHAGRLPARLSHRSADALRAAALQGARVNQPIPRRVGVAPGAEGAATIWAPAAIARRNHPRVPDRDVLRPRRRSRARGRGRGDLRRQGPRRGRGAPAHRRRHRAPRVASRRGGARRPSGWPPRSGRARSRWWCPVRAGAVAPGVTAGRDTVARARAGPPARAGAGRRARRRACSRRRAPTDPARPR